MKILAILFGKVILKLTRLLRFGGGSAAPGLFALNIYPYLVKDLSSQIPKNIVITGTNGKTTTARFLALFLKQQNFKVLRNLTGSNLERGVASTLIQKSSFLGKISNIDLGVWELDEAAFNTLVFKIKPQIIIFLNAFRDQLDRYGEIDSVVRKWQEVLLKIEWNPIVLINGNDGNIANLKNIKNIQSKVFMVKGVNMMWEKKHSRDNLKADFLAQGIKNKGLDGVEFKLKINNQVTKVNLSIPGVYHIFDFLAGFAAYYLLKLPIKEALGSLKHFSPAFGRVEKFSLQPEGLKHKKEGLIPSAAEGYIFLIKNPAGATLVFETIAPQIKKGDCLLIALNDNFADGQDVSWIWDLNFENLTSHSESDVKSDEGSRLETPIICSGKRAFDLALRLKYAGFNSKLITIEPDLTKAFNLAKSKTQGRLFILPTYTSLLELQKILVKQGIKKHYWREE